MVVIWSSQATRPLLLMGKELFSASTLAWRVARVAFGLMDSSLSACGKLFPKGMQASFSRGDYLSLSLAEPIRESGYEVSPRNNLAGVQ